MEYGHRLGDDGRGRSGGPGVDSGVLGGRMIQDRKTGGKQ